MSVGPKGDDQRLWRRDGDLPVDAGVTDRVNPDRKRPSGQARESKFPVLVGDRPAVELDQGDYRICDRRLALVADDSSRKLV